MPDPRAESVSVRCYTRVSTEEQAHSGYSLAAQRQQVEAYADRMGWHCGAWYIDEGKSAKDLNRPEFQRMMLQSQRGDVIVVSKLDRLTRSVRDLDDLLRTFEQRGLLFQSATEHFETRTPGGRLYMGIIAVIAQWEREIIADRSAIGKKQKVVQGEWAGGPVPFGYASVPSGRFKRGRELIKLVADPERAHIVRMIFEGYTAGQGMRALCTRLNDEARVPTAHGARWRVSSLSRLLTNPLYAGFVTHGRRSGAETLVVKGSHPALVAEELFAAAQRMFARRRSMAPRQTTGIYALTGIALCGVCGSAIDAVRRRHTFAYRCRNYGNGVGCGDGSRKANSGTAGHVIENLVVTAIDRLPHPANLAAFGEQCADDCSAQTVDSNAELRRLHADFVKLGKAVRRWEELFEIGTISWEELEQKTSEHRAAMRVRRNQLDAVQHAPARSPMEGLPSGAFSFKRAWDHLAPPERKALLQEFVYAFGVQILIAPDRRLAFLRTPPSPSPQGMHSVSSTQQPLPPPHGEAQ